MAQMKVFVSSTCYDLKQIRNNLHDFIDGYGFMPIMSEYNGVAYNTTSQLSTDCYNEVKNCDIVVGIVGGRFGSEDSDTETNSITMSEIEHAISEEKQTYIFVEKSVINEFYTYKKLKEQIPNISEYQFNTIDNIKIFEFLEKLKKNSRLVILDFENSKEIINALKLQWSGLFQNLLSNRSRNKKDTILEDFSSKLDEIYEQNEKTKEFLELSRRSLDKTSYHSFYNVLTELVFKRLFMLGGPIIQNKTDLVNLLKNLQFKVVHSKDHYIAENESLKIIFRDELFDVLGKVKFSWITDVSKFESENNKKLFEVYIKENHKEDDKKTD